MNQDSLVASGRPELKVFVSSPGDVAEERLIAERVLDRLAAEFAPVARIEAILWEHEPLLASGTFQTQIIRPADTDIVVCILWSRLGTRLPQQFKHPDGSPYNSGTEFEFEDALQGHKQRGVPDLLVYRKTSEPLVSLKDTQAASQALRQKMLLDEFVERFFHGDDGTLIAAFHPFENAADFETRLEDHLRKLIQDRLRKLGISLARREAVVRPTWTEGSPFRGLQVFEFQHHAVFFGRTRAIGEILERLKRQAAEGRAFLLVLGVSGCGKSSLLRAGVLPDLVQPGVVEGVGLWRRTILRPGERSGDLFDGLAAALRREEALPELASDGTTVEQLAFMLRSNPEAAPHLIKGALSQAASHLVRAESSSVQPAARLILVLDQLEELFTAADLSPEQRTAFFRAIAALAQSGQTWVMATLRSDFYHRCAEITGLVDLKAGAGQYDVQPPDAAEIAQLVRRPTLAAGLQFEPEDPQTGQRLDDLMRDAAAANRDSLPLLEFTLDELYRLRSGNTLTLQAYRELGGMEGALARRADEVFAGLPDEAKAALPHVFRQLVTIGGDEEETPTRKQAPLESFDAPETGRGESLEAGSKTSPARQLVEAFIAARLLTAKRTDDGTPVVEVTHEALLSRWQPLAEWLRDDRELLRIRGRVGAEAAHWVHQGRRADLLLQTGKPLEEGLQLQSAGFPLSAAESQFIAMSLAAAHRRTRLRRSTIAALATLTVAACALAVLAWIQRDRANENANRAVENARQAVAAQAEADRQRNVADERRLEAETEKTAADQQRKVADEQRVAAIAARKKTEFSLYCSRIQTAHQKYLSNDTAAAKRLLADCPAEFGQWEWDYLNRDTNPAYRTIFSFTGSPDDIAIDAAHLRLAVKDSVELYPGATNPAAHPRAPSPEAAPPPAPPPAPPLPPGSAAPPAAKEPLPKQGDDPPKEPLTRVAKVVDLATGKTLVTLAVGGVGHVFSNFCFSPDGRFFAAGCDNTVETPPAPIKVGPDQVPLPGDHGNSSVALWEAASGKLLFRLPLGPACAAIGFSADGRLVAAAGFDTDCGPKLIAWDTEKGKEVCRVRSGVGSISRCLVISPDLKQIAVIADSGSDICVVDVATAKIVRTLRGHTSWITGLAYQGDGNTLASSCYNLTKLWYVDWGCELRSRPVVKDDLAFRQEGTKTLYQSGITWNRPPEYAGPFTRSVDFRIDRRRVLVGKEDRLEVRDLQPAPEDFVLVSRCVRGSDFLQALGNAEAEPYLCLAFSPDGKRLALWDGGEVCAWDLASRRVVVNYREADGPVTFSPDGTRLLSRTGKGDLKIWDAASGETRLDLKTKADYFTFSPDGRRIAMTIGRTASAQELDSPIGMKTSQPRAPDEKRSLMALSIGRADPDSKPQPAPKDLASGRILDAETGDLALAIPFASDPVAYWPDGLKVALTGVAGRTATMTDRAPLRFVSDSNGPLAISADGRRLAVAVANTVCVFAADNGKLLTEFQGHRYRVTSVAFSPDREGKRVVSASLKKSFSLVEDSVHLATGVKCDKVDGDVILWDTASGQPLLTFPEPSVCVAFSPDGRRIASAGPGYGAVKVWDAGAGLRKEQKGRGE